MKDFGNPNSSELLQIRQVAKQLNLSEKTVRRSIMRGELPSHRLGRSIRVSRHDLARFIASTRRTV